VLFQFQFQFQFQRQLGTELIWSPGSIHIANLDRARTESGYSYEDDDGQAACEAMRHGGHEDGHAQARRNLQAAGNKPPRNFGLFFFFFFFHPENEAYV